MYRTAPCVLPHNVCISPLREGACIDVIGQVTPSQSGAYGVICICIALLQSILRSRLLDIMRTSQQNLCRSSYSSDFTLLGPQPNIARARLSTEAQLACLGPAA